MQNARRSDILKGFLVAALLLSVAQYVCKNPVDDATAGTTANGLTKSVYEGTISAANIVGTTVVIDSPVIDMTGSPMVQVFLSTGISPGNRWLIHGTAEDDQVADGKIVLAWADSSMIGRQYKVVVVR